MTQLGVAHFIRNNCVFHTDKISCVACEHACPTRPFRAIYVEGNAVHKRAKKPVVKKAAPAVDESLDFPF